jgi:hypothetical protein
LMAAVPLHRLLRLRLAHNGSYDHESSEADDGGVVSSAVELREAAAPGQRS